MVVWYVNSRTPPRFWHPSQMACQIGCRAQISLPGPRSWNITRVDAETPWPEGKHTVGRDGALISTAHPVVSARWPTGIVTPLILSAFNLLWVCTFFPARLCKVKVLYPVWTNFELKAKLDQYLLMLEFNLANIWAPKRELLVILWPRKRSNKTSQLWKLGVLILFFSCCVCLSLNLRLGGAKLK